MFDAGYERIVSDHPNTKIVSTCTSWHRKKVPKSPVALCTTWGPPKTAPGGVHDTSGTLRSPYLEMHEGTPSKLKSPSCDAEGDASPAPAPQPMTYTQPMTYLRPMGGPLASAQRHGELRREPALSGRPANPPPPSGESEEEEGGDTEDDASPAPAP